jgi:anti-anti-sigma factor
VSFSPSLPRRAPRADAVAPLVVRLDLVGGRVELAGRLDHRSAPLLHDAVSALLRTAGDRWVIDVAGLTGCDHSGLRTIGAAYRRALRRGKRLTLVGSSPALQAALARLRLHHHVIDHQVIEHQVIDHPVLDHQVLSAGGDIPVPPAVTLVPGR